MVSISSSSPGKSILFGEHAVVYDQPAIAVPVHQVKSNAFIRLNHQGKTGEIWIEAPDIGINANMIDISSDHPIVMTCKSVIKYLNIYDFPAFRLKLTSSIPIAAGLGSGASVSIVIIRAISSYLDHPLSDNEVNNLAFEMEKLYHGTPSGIDNTVITYAVPIYFKRHQPFRLINVTQKLMLVIADTGIKSLTSHSVSNVRKLYNSNPERYSKIFYQIGKVTETAYQFIENGKTEQLGNLMNENQSLLQTLNVSCSELDVLIEAARKAGALGAKLSGGGLGGNMIALVTDQSVKKVNQVLLDAGAVNTIITTIDPKII